MKVRSIYSNLEEIFKFNTCVLLRHESIVPTPNLIAEFSLAQDWQRLSMGELVDGH